MLEWRYKFLFLSLKIAFNYSLRSLVFSTVENKIDSFTLPCNFLYTVRSYNNLSLFRSTGSWMRGWINEWLDNWMNKWININENKLCCLIHKWIIKRWWKVNCTIPEMILDPKWSPTPNDPQAVPQIIPK